MPDDTTITIHAGPLAEACTRLEMACEDVVGRIWERDHTLWREDPTELADRLGWLDAPTASRDLETQIAELVAAVTADGFERVVVIGMGGSSLFPDVLAATFPASGLALQVLDSTHPAAVQRVLDLPAETTLFVVSSKSGSTLETRSHLEAMWASRSALLSEPGRAFVAVTDPGSALEALAGERRFRAVLHGDPTVGGRFSALTAFGLVPAGLLGVDVGLLLATAAGQSELERSTTSAPGYALGAFLAAAGHAGRDKVTLVLDPTIAAFGDWIEQLVAESLGKEGVSVTPIVGDDREGEVPSGDDRVHVVIGEHPAIAALLAAGGPVAVLALENVYDLGAQVFTWEFATAVAGALLDLQPFDQPDVASAKAATAEVLRDGLTEIELTPLAEALEAVAPGDLVAITAFIDPGSDAAAALPAARARIRDRVGAAVTLGIGPRYLHSTGQLHKGGAANIVVLQVVDEPDDEIDVEIPGRDETFADIFLAQAEGDLDALQDRDRRVFRIALDDLLA